MSSSSSSNTVSTKCRKSNGKCCPPSPCDVNCCVPERCLDCCTPAYQRLEKVRKAWSTIAATGGLTNFLPLACDENQNIVNVLTRGEAAVAVPEDTIFEQGGLDNNGITIATCATSGAPMTVQLANAYYGYLFVNTHRYLNFEACGKLDQVLGWLVDTSVGQLELFQALPDLNLQLSDNRQYLIDQAVTSLSSTQKAKLYALNVLYKASLKAIEAVSQNPKTEGNIVCVTDKCGQKWLIAINRAAADADICNVNTQYVVVAIPLC